MLVMLYLYRGNFTTLTTSNIASCDAVYDAVLRRDRLTPTPCCVIPFRGNTTSTHRVIATLRGLIMRILQVAYRLARTLPALATRYRDNLPTYRLTRVLAQATRSQARIRTTNEKRPEVIRALTLTRYVRALLTRTLQGRRSP